MVGEGGERLRKKGHVGVLRASVAVEHRRDNTTLTSPPVAVPLPPTGQCDRSASPHPWLDA